MKIVLTPTNTTPPEPPIGVVGIGMVGRALVEGFREHVPLWCYDVKTGLRRQAPGETLEVPIPTNWPLPRLAQQCRVIFICVPTPMHRDGSQDLTILESVLNELAPELTGCLVVIKSTVLPGTTARLQDEHPHCQLVFNPEFLREKTAIADFRAQDRVIVGTAGQAAPQLQALYARTHPHATYYETDATTAELVKYTANCFLAVKVSFANEIAQIAAALGVDYPDLIRLVTTDARIGASHLQVPGPDGKPGFGMTCFPKDLNALIRTARAVGVAPTMLEAAWHKNLEVRPERDWEQLTGRAVSQTDPLLPEAP